jgi:hypothetical protein
LGSARYGVPFLLPGDVCTPDARGTSGGEEVEAAGGAPLRLYRAPLIPIICILDVC